MDENYNAENQDPMNEEELEELSFSDKLVGIFTAPSETFAQVAKFPPKAMDWFIPLLLSVIISVISINVMFSNPEIKQKFLDKAYERMEDGFTEQIDNGTMSEEDVESAKTMAGTWILIGTNISAVFMGVIIFFLITLILFLLSKYALNGDGGFSSALSAMGLAYYYIVLKSILALVAAMLLGQFMQGLSVGDFMGADQQSFTGGLLYMLDPVFIAALAVTAIGLSKMYKAEKTGPYYGIVFGSWIILSVIFIGLGSMFS